MKDLKNLEPVATTGASPAAASARELIRFAALCGMASGVLEGLLYYLFQELQWLNWEEFLLTVRPPQIVFSAAVNTVLFVAVTGAAVAIARLWPWRYWSFLIRMMVLFLALLPLLDFSGRIQMRGAALLAMGLAVQLARWATSRQRGAQTWVRKAVPALAGAVALVAALTWAGPWVSERIQVGRLPAPVPSTPNVLLIVVDTVRPDHLSAYGYPRLTTPTIDRLAGEGVLFEKAYATSSWTLPSHVSLLTGLLPHAHGAYHRDVWQPVASRFPVLGEALQRRGYVTGGFVANTVWLTRFMRVDRGFQRFDSTYHSWPDRLVRSYYGRQAHRWVLRRVTSYDPFFRQGASSLNAGVLRWIDTYPERPFFAFINYMEAHEPIRLPASFQERFRGEAPGMTGEVPLGALSAKEAANRARAIGEYDSALRYLDSQIGNLLEELERRGRLQNTLVIVTSDHGELFGEHGLFGHGNSAFEQVVRVPLILWLPDRTPRGKRVSSPVSQKDVAATVLNLVGSGGASELPGLSLASHWRGTPPPQPVIVEVDGADFPALPPGWPVRQGWLKAVVSGPWKLILHQDGAKELYCLAVDPWEQLNRAADRDQASRVEEMLRQLTGATDQLAQPGRTGKEAPGAAR